MKETQEFLSWLIKGAVVLREAKANDGKINAADTPLALPVLLQSGEALGGFANIAQEVKDSTPEERRVLLEPVADLVKDFTDDEIDQTIEDGLEIVYRLDRIFERHVLRDDEPTPAAAEEVSE